MILAKPLVLITRPVEDVAETIRLVAAMGFEAMHAPALEICDTDDPLPDIAVAAGLIFSSARAVRALMRRCPAEVWLSRTVFAVGDHTAQTARDSGFVDVRSAGGNMADLAGLIRESCPPCTLIHCSGADIRDDPAALLPVEEGWHVRRVVLYRALPVGHIPDQVSGTLRQGRIRAILFYSARSAESFLSALVKSQPQVSCDTAKALCLAPPVVDSVQKFNLSWDGVCVSKTPDQAGMMALLGTLARNA